jgi:hypothetical protein
MSKRRRGRGAARRGERGAALVIAILVLTILTVIGIALMLITSTESRIAANEWSVNRAFYSADSGVRWASAEMAGIQDFMKRPEYCNQPNGCPSIPFGTLLFPLPSNRHGAGGFFTGDSTAGGDIQVRVQAPSLVGRRFAPGYVMNFGSGQARYVYAFEVRSTGSENDAFLQYTNQLVADVEVGPLADRLPF